MRVLKRSSRQRATVTLVLLDWSVRESFQLLHYLGLQTAARDRFEVVVVEYYSRQPAELTAFADQIDTWVLLEMPAACYYHKHLMYNVGIVFARGEVVVFCDSDAMVRDTFITSLAAAFDGVPVALHMDQFRNVRRDLYPFRYPSFEEVLGPGCINNSNGRPRGLAEGADPLHDRNYGACMAARRADLIAIGGADEHIDYLGHICGPYELTFRLRNTGVPEVWHQTEFLYHTWHPGQAGAGNYLGPHDGRHMSTTALDVLRTGRTAPLLENTAIAKLRTTPGLLAGAVEADLIAPNCSELWAKDLSALADESRPDMPVLLDHYRGFNLVGFANLIYGVPVSVGTVDLRIPSDRDKPGILTDSSLDGIRRSIESAKSDSNRQAERVAGAVVDPILIRQGYRRFNIIWWSDRYYAIPQGEGAFDPERVRSEGYSRAFEGESERSVTRSIDRHLFRAHWRSFFGVGRRPLRLR